MRQSQRVKLEQQKLLYKIYLVILIALLITGTSFFIYCDKEKVTLTYSREIGFNSMQKESVNLKLKGAPETLKMSGKILGSGKAKVYVVLDNDRYLVVDSGLAKQNKVTGSAIMGIKDKGDFDVEIDISEICGDCEVDTSKITIEADTENSVVYIKNIQYTITVYPNKNSLL